MNETPGFTPNSPLTRKPRKPSRMILWVFLAALGGIVLVVAANMILGPGPGEIITGVAYTIVVVGVRTLRWWAERSEGPKHPIDRWLT